LSGDPGPSLEEQAGLEAAGAIRVTIRNRTRPASRAASSLGWHVDRRGRPEQVPGGDIAGGAVAAVPGSRRRQSIGAARGWARTMLAATRLRKPTWPTGFAQVHCRRPGTELPGPACSRPKVNVALAASRRDERRASWPVQRGRSLRHTGGRPVRGLGWHSAHSPRSRVIAIRLMASRLRRTRSTRSLSGGHACCAAHSSRSPSPRPSHRRRVPGLWARPARPCLFTVGGPSGRCWRFRGPGKPVGSLSRAASRRALPPSGGGPARPTGPATTAALNGGRDRQTSARDHRH
jgi:hypothetical protein